MESILEGMKEYVETMRKGMAMVLSALGALADKEKLKAEKGKATILMNGIEKIFTGIAEVNLQFKKFADSV